MSLMTRFVREGVSCAEGVLVDAYCHMTWPEEPELQHTFGHA
jgi:hypothetical protein